MQQITRDAAVVDLAQQGEPVADQKLARNRIAPGCLNQCADRLEGRKTRFQSLHLAGYIFYCVVCSIHWMQY